MPKQGALRAIAHLLMASAIYAFAVAVSFLLVHTLAGSSATLGEGVTFLEAATFAALLLFIAGVTSMGAVLTPISVVLARLGLGYYSLIMLLSAVAGALPMLALTWGPKGFGQGLEDGAWLPSPIVFFAFAGCVGGFYLWLTWFRHLTARC